jgi:hypothetical protein
LKSKSNGDRRYSTPTVILFSFHQLKLKRLSHTLSLSLSSNSNLKIQNHLYPHFLCKIKWFQTQLLQSLTSSIHRSPSSFSISSLQVSTHTSYFFISLRPNLIWKLYFSFYLRFHFCSFFTHFPFHSFSIPLLYSALFLCLILII